MWHRLGLKVDVGRSTRGEPLPALFWLRGPAGGGPKLVAGLVLPTIRVGILLLRVYTIENQIIRECDGDDDRSRQRDIAVAARALNEYDRRCVITIIIAIVLFALFSFLVTTYSTGQTF